ncbi:MAG: universal stress protein [Chloroflexi bacterium]|nr:universal stress protein [Chloroflexota bacterium]
MIRRILVPLDSWPLAESVLPYVQQYAQVLGASVTLLQVLEPHVRAADLEALRERFQAEAHDDSGRPANAEAAAEHYLATTAEALAQAGVETHVQLADGLPAGAIVATGRQFDLIAMATHGRSGIGRWVYGSVADKVLRGATAPVLLVRAQEAPAPPARPRRIIVPLDGSALAEQTLPLATLVARGAGAQIVLLQSVFWAELAAADYPYGYGPAIQAEDVFGEAEADASDYLTSVSGRLQAEGVAVRSAIRFEAAADAILAGAADEGADLIVMSTHGRGGLGRWVYGSVADRVLRGATTPVLLVRAGVPLDTVVAPSEPPEA